MNIRAVIQMVAYFSLYVLHTQHYCTVYNKAIQLRNFKKIIVGVL
jgi:hypothetical protein